MKYIDEFRNKDIVIQLTKSKTQNDKKVKQNNKKM